MSPLDGPLAAREVHVLANKCNNKLIRPVEVMERRANLMPNAVGLTILTFDSERLWCAVISLFNVLNVFSMSARTISSQKDCAHIYWIAPYSYLRTLDHNFTLLLLKMRRAFFGLLSAFTLNAARAADYTIVVNGTSSHTIPDTLCETFRLPTIIIDSWLL